MIAIDQLGSKLASDFVFDDLFFRPTLFLVLVEQKRSVEVADLFKHAVYCIIVGVVRFQ